MLNTNIYIRYILLFLFPSIFISCENSDVNSDIIPSINLNVKSINFNEIEVGKGKDTIILIYNSGNAPLIISNIIIEGENASEFNVARNKYPFTIPPGIIDTVLIQLIPVKGGNKTAQISIESNAKESPVKINVLGYSFEKIPDMIVSSNSFKFKDIGFGLSCDTILVIKNIGEKDLKITNVSFSGKNPNEFAVSNLSFPLIIPVNDSIYINIKFNPISEGEKHSQMLVFSNLKNSPTLIDLYGNALGKIWSINRFNITVHAQHFEKIEDSNRVVNDYKFYYLAMIQPTWETQRKFTFNISDASHSNGCNIILIAEISEDHKKLLNLTCDYWHRNGISYGSEDITDKFELYNIPLLEEVDNGTIKTIRFKITGEESKNSITIAKYISKGFISYIVKVVYWNYLYTIWDKDSYISVEF